jgi:hypothetical protein
MKTEKRKLKALILCMLLSCNNESSSIAKNYDPHSSQNKNQQLNSTENTDSSEDATLVSSIKNTVQSQFNDLKKRVTRHSGEADSQIKKLFKIEYSVLELEPTIATNVLEKKLREMGVKRWDCQVVPKQRKKTIVICKRLPWSYLKLLSSAF